MRYLLMLILGLLLGGGLVYYFFVGAPRMEKLPGEIVRAPEQGGDPPGTAVLTLDEQFFNTLLSTIFRDMSNPTFKLGALSSPSADDATATTAAFDPYGWEAGAGVRFVKTQAGGCQSQIVIKPEGSGVQTGVRLTGSQISAPLAFQGSYGIAGQCLNFSGWAQANIQLSFKQDEQTLYGQINVEGVNLDGVSPLFGGVVTGFVQNAINQRVNPLTLMRGQQLQLNVPVQATGGTLQGKAREIRSEIKDGALRLHVTYDFSAAGGAAAPPAG